MLDWDVVALLAVQYQSSTFHWFMTPPTGWVLPHYMLLSACWNEQAESSMELSSIILPNRTDGPHGPTPWSYYSILGNVVLFNKSPPPLPRWEPFPYKKQGWQMGAEKEHKRKHEKEKWSSNMRKRVTEQVKYVIHSVLVNISLLSSKHLLDSYVLLQWPCNSGSYYQS